MTLEGEAQAKLDLSGSTERVNPRSDAYAIYVVSPRAFEFVPPAKSPKSARIFSAAPFLRAG